ncbi:MAG: DUF1573 domain-containing protein [Bacteroidaceae bacterium]|nr:DUF1573 domain-containing protein [Bacteroidaceae bacterium]
MYKAVLLFVLVCCLAACDKQLKPASVILVDPVRHYYPVIQGEMMNISYEIENTSDNPLFIQEIQTTCGCLVSRNDLPIVILPHKAGFVNLTFNTIKNTGFVEHFVYCYGNFQDSTCVELAFDTNIVPRADYVRDYEQLWQEQSSKVSSIQELAGEMPGHKGYYTESGTDAQTRRKDAIQEEVDKILP